MKQNFVFIFMALLLGCAQARKHPTHQTKKTVTKPDQVLVEEFSLPTADGVTTLQGQIDFPSQSKARMPVVIMVPGTGPFDRDAHFSEDSLREGPFDPRGLLFKELSKQIVAKGVATVRMDKRGISCNAVRLQEQGEVLPPHKVMKRCLSAEIRHTVTPETIRQDIWVIYEFIKQHPKIDPSRIVFFAHSEGTVHVAHLIAQQLIVPKAIILMGAFAESPKDILHWQVVTRTENVLMERDEDANDRLTLEEVKTKGDLIGIPVEAWLAQQPALAKELVLGVERKKIREFLEESYQTIAAQMAQVPDTTPYGNLASMKWWKMFFFDEQAVGELFRDFEGLISVHNGAIDFQTPATREIDLFRQAAKKWKQQPELNIYEGLGHGLGEDPIYGPMNQRAQSQLVDDIVKKATSTN